MLSDSTSVRPATRDDWPAIRSLLEENYLPLDGAREHLADYLVALTDKVIVGCAGLERHEDVALLRSVAVAPLMRAKGIGKLLTTRIMDEARRTGVSRLYLLTLTAEDYFASRGFVCQSPGSAPAALTASAEFQGVCPDSAVLMSVSLGQIR